MIKRILFCVTASVLLFVSCKKDIPPVSEKSTTISQGNNGVYITNEGNFQFGNAMVSYYADGMTDAVEDLFQPANHRPLGDVCQSIYLFNRKVYIIVNNSGKIEVVNPSTFVSTATISGLKSPRYFLPVSNSKAYISDMYANAISVVDLNSNTVTGTIPCPGQTQELLLAYGKVFVTNEHSNKLYVINSSNDMISDSIIIGYGSNSIVEDKNSKLWILCAGKSGNPKASLHRINPVDNTIEYSWSFDKKTDSPWRLNINGGRDILYFLNKNCYGMAVTDTLLPSTELIASNGRNFYGLGINPNNGNIYISDAIDYVQRGKVYIYKPDGNVVTNFLAGIIPNSFYFK